MDSFIKHYNIFQKGQFDIPFITFSTKVKVYNQQNRAFNDQFLFEMMLQEQPLAMLCCQ